jgi:ankyrin repeat protein
MSPHDRPVGAGILRGDTWAAGIIAGCIALWMAVAAIEGDGRTTAGRWPEQVDRTGPWNTLWLAVARCDLDAVEAELVKGSRPFVDGDLSFESGMYLDEALACGPAMAGLLATYGVEDDGGDSVLHVAVGSDDPALVAAVLDVGADVDAVDDAGDSPLLGAATFGDEAIVEQLLAAGADPDLANDLGHTPLFRATGAGRSDVVEQLLAAGASPEAEATVNATDLYVAIVLARLDDGFLDRVERAAEAFGGAVDDEGSPVGPFGDAGPLFAAATLGDAEIVRLLLDAGADPNVRGGAAQRLPVDAARIMGNDDVVALLGG